MKNNILSTLSKEEKNKLDIFHYKKNQTIFKEGEICSSIGVVVSGSIEIVSYSFSGKEIVFNSLSRNQIFGNNLIFSSDPIYKGNVVSKDKTTIVFISKDNLLELLSLNKKFLEKYLRIQSDFGKYLNSQIRLFSIDSAKERFEYYLFINKNHILYKSVSDLATKLNLKRETLSRLLSRLEKENVIKRSLHTIDKLD